MIIKTKEASVMANLGALRSALSIYYSDNEGICPDPLYVAETLAAEKIHGCNSLGSPATRESCADE